MRGALWGQGLHAQAHRRPAALCWRDGRTTPLSAFSSLPAAGPRMGWPMPWEADVNEDLRAHPLQRGGSGWPLCPAATPGPQMPRRRRKRWKPIGESYIAKGVANLLHDMRQGHISMTDERVASRAATATTEGAVEMRTSCSSSSNTSRSRPCVPSGPSRKKPLCINKYYILDLQPENSLIRATPGPRATAAAPSW